MKTELVEALKAMAGKARFVSLNYTNAQGERARYTIILNGDYRNVLEKSLLELTLQLPDLQGVEREACEALMASIRKSLDANALGEVSANYTKRDTYIPLADVPGVKVNLNDGSLELSGLLHSKVILEAGEPRKAVKSSELTLAKNWLRKQTPQGKYRSFCVENIHAARMNGETLELD